MEVALTNATFVAGTPPKNSVQPATRFAPLMVRSVPPAIGPLAGTICAMVGVLGGSTTSTKYDVDVLP